ncbi:MAG: hypothetical protein H0V64_04230 [Geodermatophilaceae bacterium]|nr:hypothetical protein [Geodermatophilaceae bacterium]MDQ3465564.1 hypothetical protein [Actinomycetota bacterium]
MNDDRSIHDLLERAVRDLSPTAADPAQAVLARARRERRRSVVLTVAASLVVLLGGAGVLNVIDTQTRGAGPAAGPGDRPAGWESGQPDEALLREEVQAAEQAAADAAAAAEQARAGELGNGLVVSALAAPLAVTPAGWTEFPATEPDGQLDLSNLNCPSTGNVLYRATISVPDVGGTARPCNGDVVAPYIWERSGVSPGVGSAVVQTVLDNGVQVWVWGPSGGRMPFPDGYTPVVNVFVPASGGSVTAVGVPAEELLTYLEPATAAATPFVVPGPQPGLSVSVVRAQRGSNVQTITDQELSELLAELDRVTDSGDNPCRATDNQYQIEFRIAGSAVALVVVDGSSGCATAVSSLGGGAARVSPGLLPMLVGLSLES